MKSENRKESAASSAAQQLKPNIKVGDRQAQSKQQIPSENLVAKGHFNFSRKAVVRKPTDFSGKFLRPHKLSISNQNRTVSRG